MSSPRSSVRTLVVMMVLVTTSFVAALLYVLSSSTPIESASEEIRSDAAPSTRLLDSARSALRDLDAAWDHCLLAAVEKRNPDRTEVERASRELDARIAAYRSFPLTRTEAGLYEKIAIPLGRLRETQGRLEAALDRGDVELAIHIDHGEWRHASDALDEAIRDLVEYNVSQVVSNTESIIATRRTVLLIGLALSAFSLGIACLAMIVATRAVRRQIEVESKRAHELQMFAARVAHDLLSPLQSVSMALTIAGDLGDPRVGKAVERGLSAMDRARQVVDALLKFAVSGGSPTPGAHASLHEILPGLLDELREQAEREGIRISCDEVPHCEVACAPGAFVAILSNLVRNAIRYMGASTAREIHVRMGLIGERLRCEVQDTGPGVPEGLGASLFQPYVRGHEGGGGIGLGLATVRRLVDAHGGSVGFSSPPEGGALFWFDLPTLPAPAPAAVPSKAS